MRTIGESINIVGGLIFDTQSKYHLKQRDIFIKDGKIESFERVPGCRILDVEGAFISSGWIDSHVHCFPGESAISINPNEIGIKKGVTTLIDAGTSGSDTVGIFQRDVIDNCETDIKVLLNVSSSGLLTLNELSEENAISFDKIKNAIKENENIIGLKVRMSGSVLGNMGLKPLKKAKAIAKECDLPLVVHIGNAPPEIDEVLEHLDKGDVVTHMYNSKPNGLFTKDGTRKKCLEDAINRGVKFDVGHGSASFSFTVARDAIKMGTKPDTISTDLYEKNIEKPVESLALTMSKLMEAGLTIEETVECVTKNVSDIYNIKGGGSLEVGKSGDLTIFLVTEENTFVVDSDGNKIELKKKFKTQYTCKGGKIYCLDGGGGQNGSNRLT